MKNRGFTLVELSIVLVIIGLLIGGILVGQSLIESSKAQAFVRQIQQFDIAATQFRTKFKCLPGDNSKMNTIGNCDGSITSSSNDDYYNMEIANFWSDLVNSKNISGKLTGTPVSSAFVLDITLPRMKLGTDCGILLGSTTSGSDVISNYLPGNFYSIHKFALTNAGIGAFSENPCMSVESALAVDAKMDDGSAIGGIVIGGFSPGTDLSSFNIITTPSNLCYTPSTGKYLITNSGDNCGLHIKLLATH